MKGICQRGSSWLRHTSYDVSPIMAWCSRAVAAWNFDEKIRFLGLLILEAMPLSQCALFALLILRFYFTVSLAPKFSFILVNDWVFGLGFFSLLCVIFLPVIPFVITNFPYSRWSEELIPLHVTPCSLPIDKVSIAMHFNFHIFDREKTHINTLPYASKLGFPFFS